MYFASIFAFQINHISDNSLPTAYLTSLSLYICILRNQLPASTNRWHACREKQPQQGFCGDI